MKHKFSGKGLADVLFEAAKSNDSLDSARDSITEFDRLLRINNDLKSFVQSKRFSQTEKQAILIDSLGASFNGLVLGVVSYVDGMLAHRTINQIKKSFVEKYKHAKNIVTVHATLSDQISDNDLRFMEKKIGNLLDRSKLRYLSCGADTLQSFCLRKWRRFSLSGSDPFAIFGLAKFVINFV